MKLVLDYCAVIRDSKRTTISVQEALKNRKEMMRCPECDALVRPHDAHTDRSPQRHFEHLTPTPEDCRWSTRSKGKEKSRPRTFKVAAAPGVSSL
jgi:hypothetical protein